MADATSGLAADTSSYTNPTTNKLLATAGNSADNLNSWLTAGRQQQALQLGQQQITQEQIATGQKQLGALHQVLGGIIADPSPNNAYSQIAAGVKAGVIRPDDATAAIGQITGMLGPTDDPTQPNAAIRRFAYDHVAQAMTVGQQLDASGTAPPQPLNTGGSIVPVVSQGGLNPRISQGAGGSMATTLTPAERTGRISSVDPTTGAETSNSVGQLYDSRGNFIGGGAQAPQASPPTASSPQSGATGSMPPAGGSGSLTTKLSPGASSALAGSADTWRSLASDVASPGGVNTRLNMLDNALGALRNSNTGLGTAGRQKIQSYLAALPGGVGKWAAGDPTKLSDYDLASKYLTAYSLNTPGAARSDAGLDTAGAANASVNINPQAAQEVTLNNIGLERMKQAQANAFIQSGQDPGTFSNWSTKWGQNIDPRAFALGSMTPPERTAYFSTLKGKQLAAFRDTVRKGIATGVLSRDDLTGAPNAGQ